MSSRVLDKHLKALTESGDLINFTIKIDRELHKKFKKKTVNEETTMTEILINYIIKYID